MKKNVSLKKYAIILNMINNKYVVNNIHHVLLLLFFLAILSFLKNYNYFIYL